MNRLIGLLCVMTALLIAFTADVRTPVRAASGVIIVNPNCAASPTPAPSTNQQVTYVDQNGNACTTATLSGTVTTTPQGCGTATIANTLTKPINNNGSATSLRLVAGVAAQIVHICGINIGPVAGAVNIALIEGTRNVAPCDTGTAGMAGGATAATGWQFALNSGLTYGNGIGIVAQAVTTGDDVCLAFSAATQVSGVITYAVY